MATYNLIGKRYLRKYTEGSTSPVYAAAAQAQQVVDSLCDVPWEAVSSVDARMTYHTDEVVDEENGIKGLDMNVLVRDSFDAALFCAGHVGGQHRAYANAACYRYKLPSAFVGKTLTSLSARITSDPYNSQGARLHVFTNSSGEIPTSCHACRGEDSSGTVVEDGTTAAAVAPRTATTSSGTTYWYPTTATATLEPTGGMVLQQYLFLVVALESYSTVRGNWMEGCSFIRNLVSLTTSSDVAGYADGDMIDLSDPDAVSIPVLSGGVLSYSQDGQPVGERHVVVRADSNLVAEENGMQSAEAAASGTSAASALSRAYAAFYSGEGDTPTGEGYEPVSGAAFNVTRTTEELPGESSDAPVSTDVIRIDSAALVVPFSWPRGVTPKQVSLAFAALSMPSGACFNVFLASSTEFLKSLTDEQLKKPGLYDGVDAPFALLGTITGGTSATFDVPSGTGRMGTLVITGWLPPESYSLSTGGTQGTGSAFLPDITIIAG